MPVPAAAVVEVELVSGQLVTSEAGQMDWAKSVGSDAIWRYRVIGGDGWATEEQAATWADQELAASPLGCGA